MYTIIQTANTIPAVYITEKNMWWVRGIENIGPQIACELTLPNEIL